MKFSERNKISKEYEEWLKKKSAENAYSVAYCPQTFLVFLDELGILRDIKEQKSDTSESVNAIQCCIDEIESNLTDIKYYTNMLKMGVKI